MKRTDACIDIDVDDEALLVLLAALPDKCRSINPFLRCTIGVEDGDLIPSRLLKRLSDVAIFRGAPTVGKRFSYISACGYLIMWLNKEPSDPKREWIVSIISDMLKQGVASGKTV